MSNTRDGQWRETRPAFSLIELLIVVLLLGAITAVVVPIIGSRAALQDPAAVVRVLELVVSEARLRSLRSGLAVVVECDERGGLWLREVDDRVRGAESESAGGSVVQTRNRTAYAGALPNQVLFVPSYASEDGANEAKADLANPSDPEQPVPDRVPVLGVRPDGVCVSFGACELHGRDMHWHVTFGAFGSVSLAFIEPDTDASVPTTVPRASP